MKTLLLAALVLLLSGCYTTGGYVSGGFIGTSSTYYDSYPYYGYRRPVYVERHHRRPARIQHRYPTPRSNHRPYVPAPRERPNSHRGRHIR